MQAKPVRVGVEAFYESAAAQATREAELPPQTREIMRDSIRELNLADTPRSPSLRLRVYADFDDGSRVASDGWSRAVLLMSDDESECVDEGLLAAAAQTAAQRALDDAEDDWLGDLAELTSLAEEQLVHLPKAAIVDAESVKRAALEDG